MENNKLKRSSEIVFPENFVEIIDSILKKYGLERIEDFLENYDENEKEENVQERWENLPGPHISIMIQKITENKIKDKKTLAKELQEKLNLPESAAKHLTQEIEEKILLPMKINLEEEIVSFEEIPGKGEDDGFKEKINFEEKKRDIYREPKEDIESFEEKRSYYSEPKEKKASNKDTYREPIE